ncbi:bifunctional adenosylcobinamide kinase/adenosylcobinamide-phosphate guanylyltransferase [Sphingobium amiense]|uniref:Bifunctional adenosylcobalamin biosynthesis protein n=1 Tax=Sphingobium amiense TaxID=135719 RepID=A0A494W3I1_9SPHN|nr:bifunctional adenosylcobinamide kinase/adenosylcobinamide-phosphate guanylyltransferase [Sphingobium amiense]BBD99173.1 bifunctional adenosylcobinamide kinase/adenosylcobinamide-phosphate guanylyltransferase [Sphingobium amiense]
MKRLLVLGGARSGKSRYAQAQCEAVGRRLVYIATAEAGDDEMAERIARHRSERGPCWQAMEAPIALGDAIVDAARHADAVLVDCLTLWLSNIMLGNHDLTIAKSALIRAIGNISVPLVLIANEVGLGIVPDNALARRFRDEAGRLHQDIAAVVEEVVLVAAGLPLRLKG